MKKYEVVAPIVVFPLKGENGEKKEHILKKGDVVDLPETDIAVRALLARNQIKEVTPIPHPQKGKVSKETTVTNP